MNLLNLPEHILVAVVKEFLNVEDWRHITSCSSTFLNVRKATVYLKLTRKYSKRYYDDETFRVRVRGSIMNPREQLSLLLYNFDDIRDVSSLGNVHLLNLFACKKITDVSALGNIHTLILSYCAEINDVSALGNVHSLDLSWCDKITDVSALGNVRTLVLRGCSKITDVSALTKYKYIR